MIAVSPWPVFASVKLRTPRNPGDSRIERQSWTRACSGNSSGQTPGARRPAPTDRDQPARSAQRCGVSGGAGRTTTAHRARNVATCRGLSGCVIEAATIEADQRVGRLVRFNGNRTQNGRRLPGRRRGVQVEVIRYPASERCRQSQKASTVAADIDLGVLIRVDGPQRHAAMLPEGRCCCSGCTLEHWHM
jgi:hypothetical protein